MGKKTLPQSSPSFQAQTQKAKGILALRNNGFAQFSIQALKQVRVYPYESVPAFPFFARPCPLVPRHGFVDSRIVNNEPEFTALVAEVQATKEPVIEIICMPFITPRHSGILTPASITFGPGHDGATSGTGARTVPAPSSKLDFLSVFGLPAATEAGITDTPFLEFVATEKALEAVQLRNGPDVGFGNAYIPQDMKVEHLVKANGEDLLEWEQKMIALKGKSGVVIWHPGGALSTHFAVQAIEQSKGTAHPFAVLIQDEEPKLGQTLKQSAQTVEALRRMDYLELAHVLAFALMHEAPAASDTSAAINLGIATLHAQALWGRERHLLVLRAVGLAHMLRFAGAAILGELRHWDGAGPGSNGKQRLTALYDMGTEKATAKGKLTRHQVYEKAFADPIKELAPRMGTAYRDFATKGWGSSYGGKAWAKCARVTVNLFSATGAFLSEKNEATWKEVASQWNLAVNAFHNNGPFLNKFIMKHVMDHIAKVPAYGLCSPLVGDLVLKAEVYGEHPMPNKVGKKIRVTIPPVPKPPAVVLPEEFEARWQVRMGKVYVQMRLPVTINKSYGFADFFAVAPSLVSALATCPMDAKSLTGSSTEYGRGVVRNIEGCLVLCVPSGDWQVPLTPAAPFIGKLEKALASEAEEVEV
jgi:hypothetical protein